MGGFAHAFGELIEKGTQKLATEAVEHGVYRGIFADHRAFADIPAAKALWDAHTKEVLPRINKYTSEAAETQLKLPSNLRQPSHKIESTATQRAMSEVYGPHNEAIQSVIHHVKNNHGENRAQVLSDILNILYKQEKLDPTSYTGSNPKYAKYLVDNEGLSSLDVDLRRKGNNQVFTKPSKYERSSDRANKFSKVRQLIAYGAAVPHALGGAHLGIATDAGLMHAVRAFNDAFGPGSAAKESALLASNVVSEFKITELKQEEAFRAGKISQYAPGSVGQFIHRNMLQPGMPFTRRQNLKMGAFAGKNWAEEAAQNLAHGKRVEYSRYVLKTLGIDEAKIATQKFQLAPEDIDKAYYHGANHFSYLGAKTNTPSFWKQSPWLRATNAYMGYVANQSAFERRVMQAQISRGDMLGLARNLAIKSIAYPVIGATIYEIAKLRLGMDWDDPWQHYKNNAEDTPAGLLLSKLTGQDRIQEDNLEMLNHTIEMMSHVGAFGQMTSVIRDTNRSELGRKFYPPEANMAIQVGEDAFKAGHVDSNHPHAADPLGRDVINDTLLPFGAGQILSHMILPTKKEQDKNKYHRFKRTKAKQQTLNPFNAADFNH